jgi:glycosyltransferase involved in cell wall biosynthesis
MKILVLTFYYPPDLSAGSYRASAIANALAAHDRASVQIDVLTTRPNRYQSYARSVAGRLAGEESLDSAIAVERLPVPQHRNRLLGQCVSFSSFAAQALMRTRRKRYDVVVATSSRLLTAYLGAFIARRTGAVLYLDIRDLLVDSLSGLFPNNAVVRLLKPLLAMIEQHTVEHAGRVNIVSPGFRSYFAKRHPDRSFTAFTNGVDNEFLGFDYDKMHPCEEKVVLYAGNIGLGQDLEHVVPDAAHLLGARYQFRIIGDGGRRAVLADRVRSMGLTNVALIPPVDRQRLRHEYRNADYLLLHLNDAPAMHKVLPSKTFEYAATGKPIVAGVAGFARGFIEQNVENAITFLPGDAEGLARAIRSLNCAMTDRSEFVRRYSRDRIMAAMARDILTAQFERGA